MESFLDEIFGPIVDYFEDDYHLAAAKLLEVCHIIYSISSLFISLFVLIKSMLGSGSVSNCYDIEFLKPNSTLHIYD